MLQTINSSVGCPQVPQFEIGVDLATGGKGECLAMSAQVGPERFNDRGWPLTPNSFQALNQPSLRRLD